MKRKLSEAELEMLARLKNLPDDQIDTVDIPEALAENWRLSRRPSKPETQGKG